MPVPRSASWKAHRRLRNWWSPAALEQLRDIFGPRNVYAQLQRHMDRDQEAANQAMIDQARRLRIPLLATNAPRYAHAAQRELLDILTCIRNKTTIAGAGRLLA